MPSGMSVRRGIIRFVPVGNSVLLLVVVIIIFLIIIIGGRLRRPIAAGTDPGRCSL
jgi:hypothetical protein